MVSPVNLLNFDRTGLQAFFREMDESPFRADQVIQWIHQKGVIDFNLMTNLSQVLRHKLQDKSLIRLPEIATEQVSNDGTHKWLLRLEDGNSIETVFIPEAKRGTLCVSSQVGCALDCRFCSTGKQGFSRNLTVAEIIGQVWLAVRRLQAYYQHPLNVKFAPQLTETRFPVTNVVMMGMGEPLLNFEPVVAAMNLMLDDLAYGLSKYRVTLSTSGLIPEMQQLKVLSPVSLAVSLHAPNDSLRNQLVPINKKYPLQSLMAVCRDYFKGQSKRVVTFEYVMLHQINDSLQQAKELVQCLRDVPCKLNLIPFNPFPFSEYQCSMPEAIRQFQATLQASGIHVTVRKTRGHDIDAACGQLVGNFHDRTRRNQRWVEQTRLKGIKIVQSS